MIIDCFFYTFGFYQPWLRSWVRYGYDVSTGGGGDNYEKKNAEDDYDKWLLIRSGNSIKGGWQLGGRTSALHIKVATLEFRTKESTICKRGFVFSAKSSKVVGSPVATNVTMCWPSMQHGKGHCTAICPYKE